MAADRVRINRGFEMLELLCEQRLVLDRLIWTTCRTMLDAGASASEIAAALGISVPTLHRRLREKGLTYGRGRLPTE